MANSQPQLWLIRHGETEWSLSGAHTGRTDLPLTERGQQRAQAIGQFLNGRPFALVLTSPLQRARETCRLAGYGEQAVIDENLREWDYGDYEGRSTADIRKDRPGWNLWADGVVNGETVDQVADRARVVINRALFEGKNRQGDCALFAHGHILRILTGCWLRLAPNSGQLFALDTATVSVLGWEHETRVIRSWNRSS
ncbi:MAG TPA: histidine phosphatase family protein [Bryobacteraceae bacterium]|jgi:probable phosphoglycerate mutase